MKQMKTMGALVLAASAIMMSSNAMAVRVTVAKGNHGSVLNGSQDSGIQYPNSLPGASKGRSAAATTGQILNTVQTGKPTPPGLVGFVDGKPGRCGRHCPELPAATLPPVVTLPPVFSVSPVPEPENYLMFAVGLSLVAFMARRHRSTV